MKAYKNVDDYIEDQPEEVKSLLLKIRATIRKAAKDAEEIISYGMPAYKYYGVLVYFAAFKKHIGFFPTSSGVEFFKEKLKSYKTSKGTIQFSFDKPIPVKLVADITKFRLNEDINHKMLLDSVKKAKQIAAKKKK